MEEAKNKGGNKRQPIPPVCKEELKKIFKARFEALKEKAFDLGAYNHVSKQMQANPAGLCENEKLVTALVQISNGEIRPTQLKDVAEEFPMCNDTMYKVGFWAMSKAQCLTTLLAHWRRMKFEPARRQHALAKCTQAESRAIMRLVNLQTGLPRANSEENMPLGSEGKPNSSNGPKGKKRELGKEDKSPQPGKKRQLKESSSDATLDSRGWPKMLQSASEPSSPPDEKEKVDLYPKSRRMDFQSLQSKLLLEAQEASQELPQVHLDEKKKKAGSKEKGKSKAKATTN